MRLFRDKSDKEVEWTLKHLREIGRTYVNRETHRLHGWKQSLLLRCPFSPKSIHKFNAIPIKILGRYFVDIYPMLLMFTCRRKMSRMINIILKENETGAAIAWLEDSLRLCLGDFKTASGCLKSRVVQNPICYVFFFCTYILWWKLIYKLGMIRVVIIIEDNYNYIL